MCKFLPAENGKVIFICSGRGQTSNVPEISQLERDSELCSARGLFVAPWVNHTEILFVSVTLWLNDNDGTYGFYQIKIWSTVWYNAK